MFNGWFYWLNNGIHLYNSSRFPYKISLIYKLDASYSSTASVKLTCTKDIAGPVLVQVSKQVSNTMHLGVQYKFNYIRETAVREWNLFPFFSKYCLGRVFLNDVFIFIWTGIVEITGIHGVTVQRHRVSALPHIIVCSRVRTQQQFVEIRKKINIAHVPKYFQWHYLVSHSNYKHTCLFAFLSCDTVVSYSIICVFNE